MRVIQLTPEEAQIVLNGLMEMPFKVSNNVINSIFRQIKAQEAQEAQEAIQVEPHTHE